MAVKNVPAPFSKKKAQDSITQKKRKKLKKLKKPAKAEFRQEKQCSIVVVL